jgi:hypothetical protein
MNLAQVLNHPFGIQKQRKDENGDGWFWIPKFKQPPKQCKVYTPTLKEAWITVRFIPSKKLPSAAIGNLVDIREKLMAKLTGIPQPASMVSKEACVTMEQSLNALRRMAGEGNYRQDKAIE